jgi:hypothetical protein
MSGLLSRLLDVRKMSGRRKLLTAAWTSIFVAWFVYYEFQVYSQGTEAEFDLVPFFGIAFVFTAMAWTSIMWSIREDEEI